ncbi:hypothetical protein [Pelagibacterium sediminicola]|uniref:hypothetical protein n=1 Tax=Pelagibacterium sediminicola TaxID=2248761 RepID=UPI000E31AABC|nr:hypothetical protein [Pelagibacterium sediminicola]
MPLEFTDIKGDPVWSGSSWKVVDDDDLARLIARVALGQSYFVERILKETGFAGPKAQENMLAGAIELLTAVNPDDPYHRDGWMFQVMSWIAAHLQNRTSLIREPHMIHAHKGFDGIHVKLNPDTKLVNFMVVCEEKATENARKMITGKVWPEFRSLEKAERDHQLLSELIGLLRLHPDANIDNAVEQIVWKDARSYRVSITTEDGEDLEKTFRGYADVVPGEIERRRAEALPVKDVRNWMAGIADKAIAYAEELATADV